MILIRSNVGACNRGSFKRSNARGKVDAGEGDIAREIRVRSNAGGRNRVGDSNLLKSDRVGYLNSLKCVRD